MPIPFDPALILDRPGYFGKRRREREADYDAQHGPGRWQECWQVGAWILSFEEAVTLYDDAYFEHLDGQGHGRPNLLAWVCSFRKCYDSDPCNITSGVTHDPHATPRHLQDVSVRRALVRLGRWFTGMELLHIRGPESNGHCLMPGNVPFHRPEWILPAGVGGPTREWMREGSVEHFWQANKIIVRTA